MWKDKEHRDKYLLLEILVYLKSARIILILTSCFGSRLELYLPFFLTSVEEVSPVILVDCYIQETIMADFPLQLPIKKAARWTSDQFLYNPTAQGPSTTKPCGDEEARERTGLIFNWHTKQAWLPDLEIMHSLYKLHLWPQNWTQTTNPKACAILEAFSEWHCAWQSSHCLVWEETATSRYFIPPLNTCIASMIVSVAK